MSVSFYASRDEAECPIKDYLHEVERVNWANANARLMLGLLGLPQNDELTGCVSLADARRAFIKANALFESRAVNFTRQEEIGTRYVCCGLTEEGLLYRLNAFGAFLELAMLAGARSIYWG